MAKFGIVICSRVGSSRIQNKAFKKINGLMLIEHLIRRCIDTGLPVCLAVPSEDETTFSSVLSRFSANGLLYYCGSDQDPLRRMTHAASKFGFENVVRVCHDKIFVDPDLVKSACNLFSKKNLDYLYSSQFTAGSGFEVISKKILDQATAKYVNVEHVSYAIKNLTKNTHNMEIPAQFRSDARFLIDYPEDLTFMETVMSGIGNHARLSEAIEYTDKNQWTKKINKLPKVTVYTCAYNAQKWVEKCMGSVAEQIGFGSMEYVLVDDHSTDKTPELMAEMSTKFTNIKFIRNPKNIGLSSSSNVALSEARGTYIIRLDADDYFARNSAIQEVLSEIEDTQKDAIYPNNYFGSYSKVQDGKENHHVGGAIFRRSAVNHVKFTERLRGYEGYDFFERAKDQINIGYYGEPTFFYRQRKDSMSKTNLEMRSAIKQDIENRVSGAV